MKKFLSLVAMATLFFACCQQQQPAGIAIEKFFENPEEFVGKDTTIIGKVQSVCDSTGKFTLGTDSTNLYILVTPPAEAKTCKGAVGKEVAVKGVITETVIDEEFIVALENESNTEACPQAKACKQTKAAEYREILAVDGIFSIYSIEAKCVKATDSAKCCKAGEQKACGDTTKKVCGDASTTTEQAPEGTVGQ
jgi:hypothetical protein